MSRPPSPPARGAGDLKPCTEGGRDSRPSLEPGRFLLTGNLVVYPETKEIILHFLPFHNPRMSKTLGQVALLPPHPPCMGATSLRGLAEKSEVTLGSSLSPPTLPQCWGPTSTVPCPPFQIGPSSHLDISLTTSAPGLLASISPSHPPAAVKVAVVKGHFWSCPPSPVPFRVPWGTQNAVYASRRCPRPSQFCPGFSPVPPCPPGTPSVQANPFLPSPHLLTLPFYSCHVESSWIPLRTGPIPS